MKRELKILPLEFPKFSPDLMPLDYGVWDEVDRRMSKQKVKLGETVEAFKNRLRRTAMSIPARVISKIVNSMHARAAAIAKAGGKDIPRD